MTRRKKSASWGKGHRAQTQGDQQATEPTLDLRPWDPIVSGWQEIAVKDLLSLNNFEIKCDSVSAEETQAWWFHFHYWRYYRNAFVLSSGWGDGNALQGILRQFHLLSNHLTIHHSPSVELPFAPVSPWPFPTLLCAAVSNRNQSKGLPVVPVLCLPGRGLTGTGGRWRKRGSIYSSDILFHLRNDSWSQAFSRLFFKPRGWDTSYVCTTLPTWEPWLSVCLHLRKWPFFNSTLLKLRSGAHHLFPANTKAYL